MKRKHSFELPPKILLLILSGVCVVFMAVSLIFKNSVTPLNVVSGYIFVPMQEGINSIGNWMNDRVDNIKSNIKIKNENKKLKEKVNELTLANKELKQQESKLEQYEKLYQLDQKYQGYSKVGANIIGSDSSNWYKNFTINKGKKDGLKKDMNVIADNGLVGIIIEVGPNYSKVRSVIDDSSNVSGMFAATADNCIVRGSLEMAQKGYLSVERINKDAKVSDGDEVVTSNISDKFMPGITIGYMDSCEVDKNNLTKSGKITPSVDFKHLQTVLVITDLKNDSNRKSK